MQIAEYITEVNKRYKTGISREHSYRGDLKLLKHPQLGMRKSILQALIDNGCDLTTLRNIQGKTAMDLIVERI